MSVFSGPEIPNNGLVFHYDMSNTKSWKGAPVINLAPYTDYSNHNYNTAYDIGGWGGDDADVYYYKSGGYNDLPYKKMVKHTGGTGGSYIDEHNYFTLVEGKTYIISCYMKASIATTVSGHTLALNRDADNAYRVPTDITLTTDWVKKTWTYTCAVGEGGTTYHFRQIVYNDTQLPLEVYWCGLQIAEGTAAYEYVNGARTNTQAILDLTKSTLLTANLTYASDNTFTFNGTSNNIDAGNPSSGILDFGVGDFSLHAWVKLSATNASWVSIFQKGTSGAIGYGMHLYNNQLAMSIQSGTNNQHNYGFANSTLSVGVWYSCDITFTRSSVATLYINGNQIGTADITANTGSVTTTSSLQIGSYGSSWFFPGSVPIVKIYNRALSAAEVKQNFEASRGRFGI